MKRKKTRNSSYYVSLNKDDSCDDFEMQHELDTIPHKSEEFSDDSFVEILDRSGEESESGSKLIK